MVLPDTRIIYRTRVACPTWVTLIIQTASPHDVGRVFCDWLTRTKATILAQPPRLLTLVSPINSHHALEERALPVDSGGADSKLGEWDRLPSKARTFNWPDILWLTLI
jgi:hypothetical protein